MKRWMILLICLLSFAMPAGAIDVSEITDLQREELGLDEVERQAREQMNGADIRIDYDVEENLTNLFDAGTENLKSIVKTALRSCAAVLTVVMFCTLGKGLGLSSDGKESMAADLAGTLAVSAICVADIHSLLQTGTAAVSSVASFSKILLPVVAVLTAATGAMTGAYVRQMAAVLFSTILINLIDSVIVPLLYGYIAVTVAHSATSNQGLKRIAALFKWAAVTLLTVVLLAYVGYLTLSGVVSASTDAAAVKAAKFAISSAVPVVGGILADASESVLAASGILRGSVGVFGMIAVLGICFVPFLRLGVYYLIYKAASALSAMFGGGAVSALIDSLSGAFGLMLAMVGACALMLLISIVSSVMVVTA